LTAHWGATPCIKIVRTMGLDLSILERAAVIPKPFVRKYRALRNADANMGPRPRFGGFGKDGLLSTFAQRSKCDVRAAPRAPRSDRN
jgi:hypothetical protein